MKKLLTLALTFALLCTFALAGQRSAAPAGEYAVVNNPDPEDRLNLRDAPSREGNSLGKYLNGTVAEILSRPDDTWAQVKIGQTVGYMMQDYLADANIIVAPALDAAQVASTSAYGEHLRSGPEELANPIVLVPNGTEVTILGYADGFAHVQHGGAVGYMPLDALALPGEENQGALSVMPVPEPLTGSLIRATLYYEDVTAELTDPAQLEELSTLLTNTEYSGYAMAGCGFLATLELSFETGRVAVIELASDACCIYRHDGHDYKYARHLAVPGDSPENDVLCEHFGVKRRWME